MSINIDLKGSHKQQLSIDDQRKLASIIKKHELDKRDVSLTYETDNITQKTFIIVKSLGKYIDVFEISDPMLRP